MTLQSSTSQPEVGAGLKVARFLTLIAVLPQLFLLLATLTDGASSWTAPAAAYAYASFIFSFLGGYWWGVGLLRRPIGTRLLFIAVAPMLISFALFLPWVWGWSWPGPQLLILGVCIAAAYLVDWLIIGDAVAWPEWLRIRLVASLGLGVSTALIGVVTIGNR